MPAVNAERSTYRQRQAQATQRLIAATARGLFAERGYAETSVEAVAEAAGVSPRTVYAGFGSKRAILGRICEEWLSEAGVMEAAAEAMAEPSLRRRLEIVAHASRKQWETDRGVTSMLEAAAAADAEVARMLAGWRDDRGRSLKTAFRGVESQVRPGLDPGRAGAVLRALTAVGVYTELVAGEGWTPDEYEGWLRDRLLADFLP